MNAIVVNPGHRGVMIKNIEELKEPGIRIKTLYTGICGTDREIVNNMLPFVRPEIGDELIIGHEAIGRVIETVENSNLKEGDLVVPMVRRPGKCYLCNLGRQDYCIDGDFVEAGIRGKNGFMREYFYDDEKYLIKVKNNMEKIGVLVEPTKNVMKMVEVFKKMKERIYWDCDDSTLNCKGVWIFGTGSEGILASLVFKSLGFDVTIVNRHPVSEIVNKILELNNIQFFNSTSDDWNSMLKDHPMNLSIDAAGSADIFLESIEHIDYNGIIILFGTAGKGTISDGSFIKKVVDKNLTIAGVEDGSKNHYIQAAEFLEKYFYEYSLEKLITNIFNPDEIWIFNKKIENEIKSIIKWS